MFCELIIKALPTLVKFCSKLELDFYFTKPQVRHMQAFVVAMLLNGYSGKLSQVSGLAHHADRTCVSRFLNSKSWNEAHLLKTLNAYVIGKIWSHSRKTGLPIYVLIDDTICEKTKPSSKAKQPIYGCGFHKSHLKNEIVYGHQFVAAMLRCGEQVLPLTVQLYEKDNMSKIDIAKSIIESLPKPVSKGYVMADSWYSCMTLFEASRTAGYHYLGALKSNRKIFPKGYRRKGIQIGAFASTLDASDFDLVTVDGERYYTYTYLGRINGMHKVKIVITYPKEAFLVPKAMRAFISTDIKMHGRQLLCHYVQRWPIEVFFREANRHLGMKQSQVRSKAAIFRYQYLVILAYCFCGFDFDDCSNGFNRQRSVLQGSIRRFHVLWIVQQAQNNAPLDAILAAFSLVA